MTTMLPAAEGTGPRALDAAVLRVRDALGNPVGLGFLVTENLALTCAHVVTAALGIPPHTEPSPDGRLTVDLPLLGDSAQSATATVEGWFPTRDVAVLRLEAPLPGRCGTTCVGGRTPGIRPNCFPRRSPWRARSGGFRSATAI